MELDDLKSAWNKYSSENEKNREVSEKELRKMLQKRTLDITQKISRNIRIGFGIVIACVCIGIGSNFVPSAMLERIADQPYLSDQLSLTLFLIEIFNYLLIIAAIIIFWIRYSKIEKEEIDQTDLHGTLKRIIGIIDSYRKMFNVILVIVIVYVVVVFTTGFVMDYNYKVSELGMNLQGMGIVKWIILVVSFLFAIGILVGVYIILFNLFFKRLYGRYLKKLKQTLKELNEIPA